MVTDHQLVTVLGPGGMGKSRLAIHYASKHLDLYSGGAWFVDLSSSHDLEAILAATGAALNVPLADEDGDQAIERYVKDLTETAAECIFQALQNPRSSRQAIKTECVTKEQ